MTVDREQIRRDARRLVLRHDSQFYGPMKDSTCGCELCQWPRRYLALLAELEQAEARLAKVPALVEAAKTYIEAVESDTAEQDGGIAIQVTYRDLRSIVEDCDAE